MSDTIIFVHGRLYKKVDSMLNLNVKETKKLTDVEIMACVLQCLYASMGEGVSMPQIVRFVSVQTAKPFSKFRAEGVMKMIIDMGAAETFTEKTKGGRVYRKYGGNVSTVLVLTSMVKRTPKMSREITSSLTSSVWHAADALRADAVRSNGGSN